MLTLPPEQLIARLRQDGATYGDPVDHLSDLEVLHRAYTSREADWRDTRDRYNGLLTTQRKHHDAVRAAARNDHTVRADQYARWAVTQHLQDLSRVLGAVEVLPMKPTTERIAYLKELAAQTKHLLSLKHKPLDIDDKAGTRAQETVRRVSSVVGVLATRDGLCTDAVIRLVRSALDPQGDLKDLFKVADAGKPKPEFQSQKPSFLTGPEWADRVSFYTYEPHEGARGRVVAYHVGAWHLDLISATGALLAYGIVPEDDVAVVAPALVANADAWSVDRAGYAWRRFEDLVLSLRTPRP